MTINKYSTKAYKCYRVLIYWIHIYTYQTRETAAAQQSLFFDSLAYDICFTISNRKIIFTSLFLLIDVKWQTVTRQNTRMKLSAMSHRNFMRFFFFFLIHPNWTDVQSLKSKHSIGQRVGESYNKCVHIKWLHFIWQWRIPLINDGNYLGHFGPIKIESITLSVLNWIYSSLQSLFISRLIHSLLSTNSLTFYFAENWSQQNHFNNNNNGKREKKKTMG